MYHFVHHIKYYLNLIYFKINTLMKGEFFMSKVLIGLFGFLALLFWGMLFFGDSPFYILHAWGFTFLTGLVAVFSEDSSGSYNSDDGSSYYYHQLLQQKRFV